MQDNPRDADLERKLETWAASQSDVELHPETQRKVLGVLTSSLTPVKPLPSQSRLVMGFLAIFAASAAGLIAVMDKTGFHLMTAAQMGWMAAILVGGGMLFSLYPRLANGSWQPLGPPVFACFDAMGYGGDRGNRASLSVAGIPRFCFRGMACAAMELMIAVPATVVFWLLARRGALFASAGLGAVLTGLGVFLALAPLQSQCMFQQAPHLLIWHAGTAAMLIAFGALIGELRRHRWMSGWNPR